MKRLRIFSLALVVMITSAPTHAAGPVAKPGAKCSRAGSVQVVNGNRITCVKSGSRLVWKKNETTPKSTATTSAASPVSKEQNTINPFSAQPFPDQFTRAQMIEVAVRSFDDYVKQNSASTSFKLAIDKDFEHKSTEITKLVEEIFSTLPFPAGYSTSVVVISKDRNFLNKTIQEFSGFDSNGTSPEESRKCLNCAGPRWASISLGLSQTIPHEIFHVWQRSVHRPVSGDPFDPLNTPIWLDEGGADFYGFLSYRKVDNNYYPGSLVGLRPYRLKDYISRDVDPGLPYSLGRLASEYIVASIGFNKYLSIWSRVGQGQEFPNAFASATGITLDSFYDKFDKNLPKML